MWKCLILLSLLFIAAAGNDGDQTCDNPETCFAKPPEDAKYASDCYFPSNNFLQVPVLAIHQETHNSKLITFGLPPSRSLDHKVSSAILMSVPKDEKPAMRPYNPINAKEGSFDLLIKVYPDGVAGKYVSGLKVGDKVGFKQTKGNIKKFQFPFDGFDKITMIAGGTGVAPMMQALAPILEGTKKQVRLLYGNKTPDDIMLKKQIDELAEKHKDRFKVHYVIGDEEFDSRHEGTFAETGWIDEAKIKRLGFSAASDSVVWVCGVDEMYKSLAGSRMKNLEEGSALHNLGYTDDNVWRS